MFSAGVILTLEVRRVNELRAQCAMRSAQHKHLEQQVSSLWKHGFVEHEANRQKHRVHVTCVIFCVLLSSLVEFDFFKTALTTQVKK